MKLNSFLKFSLILALSASLAACSGARVRSSGRRGLLTAGTSSPVARVGRAPTAQEIELANLTWPLRKMEITSSYGFRGGDRHEGVDLKASTGTPIFSAQRGTVIYAGSRISGYGKLTIIRHSPTLSTVYAHQSKILVLKGQKVSQGSLIGYSGKTGHVSGPHLHYEVRSGTTPLDPALFIASGGPPPRAVPNRNQRVIAGRKSSAVAPVRAASQEFPEPMSTELPRVPLQKQRNAAAASKVKTRPQIRPRPRHGNVTSQRLRVTQAQAVRARNHGSGTKQD